jgi:hypothetical protein
MRCGDWGASLSAQPREGVWVSGLDVVILLLCLTWWVVADVVCGVWWGEYIVLHGILS